MAVFNILTTFDYALVAIFCSVFVLAAINGRTHL